MQGNVPDEPLRLDVCAGSDVVLGGEDELVVEDPLGLVVQTRARVELHHLVVLHGQVVSRPLQVGDLKTLKLMFAIPKIVISVHLHEESRTEGFPNVHVVVFAGEVCAGSLQVESVHDSAQLLSDVVRGLEGSVVDEVVVAPLRVLHVLLERVEHVQQGQVVPVYVGEPQLGVVGGFLRFIRPVRR